MSLFSSDPCIEGCRHALASLLLRRGRALLLDEPRPKVFESAEHHANQCSAVSQLSGLQERHVERTKAQAGRNLRRAAPSELSESLRSPKKESFHRPRPPAAPYQWLLADAQGASSATPGTPAGSWPIPPFTGGAACSNVEDCYLGQPRSATADTLGNLLARAARSSKTWIEQPRGI